MKEKLIYKTKAYFMEQPGVIAVYLYGSHAAGKEGRASDVDIGVLIDSSERKTEKHKRTRYMVDLATILRKEIHVVILNSAGEELMRQIFHKGKCILVKDTKELSLFKMKMFSMIADFSYYRVQMQSGLIRNIMES
jgi:predicted nucleotidyltransferase